MPMIAFVDPPVVQPVALKSQLFDLISIGEMIPITPALYWEMQELNPPFDSGEGYFIFRDGYGDFIRFTDTQSGYFAQLI